MLFGGNANNGSNAGLVYANSNHVPSAANANIGSRLYFSKIKFILGITASPLGEKHKFHKGVGRNVCCMDYRKLLIRKAKNIRSMKRYGNLYEKIISIDNLKLAVKKARAGKENTYGVMEFDKANINDKKVLELYDMLLTKTFHTSEYDVFPIFEKKERVISRLPFYPDRIVHHAIMNVIESILVKTFTHNTYSCIKGRGIEGCANHVEKTIRKYDGRPLYCLKIDIKKFYPSMKHHIMKKQIGRKFKDKDLLWILDDIIDSTEGNPIGNYPSQYFANLYLSGLMHKANEEWKVDCEEYADDIVFFSDNKEGLHNLFRDKVKPYIENELELEIKNNWQIFPIPVNRYDKSGRALDYVGYKFFRNQKLMRKSIKQNFCRKVAKINKRKDISNEEYKREICSWLGWAKHSDSKHLLQTILRKDYYDTCIL